MFTQPIKRSTQFVAVAALAARLLTAFSASAKPATSTLNQTATESATADAMVSSCPGMGAIRPANKQKQAPDLNLLPLSCSP